MSKSDKKTGIDKPAAAAAPTIQVSRSRGGGKKKVDLFAHLRNTEHPLDDMFPQDVDGPQAIEAPSTNYQELPSTTLHDLPSTDSQQLPSTNTTPLPSTERAGGRQDILLDAVHNSDVLPSTTQKLSRPQFANLPSTDQSVDGTPSTRPILPSTNPEIEDVPAVIPSTAKKQAVRAGDKAPSTKGDRHNKFLARYDNRIDPKLKQRIDMFCAENGFTQKEFAEMSAVHFLELWTAGKLKIVDGMTAHDDRRLNSLFKTQPRIINLYLAYNRIFNDKTRWSVRDDDAGMPFNKVDIRIVELGIIQTQANKAFAGKINSFSYYVPEIKNFIELRMPAETLGMMLEINRQRWRQATGRELDLSFLEHKAE